MTTKKELQAELDKTRQSMDDLKVCVKCGRTRDQHVGRRQIWLGDTHPFFEIFEQYERYYGYEP